MRYALILLFVTLWVPIAVFAQPQGERAVLSGQDFETRIELALQQHGFEFDKDASDKHRKAARDVPYEALYATQARYDYVLSAPELSTPVWVEVNNQNSPGTVDEKLPYLFLSALMKAPGNHVILVLGGEGRRAGAVEWLKSTEQDPRWAAFANHSDKRVDIMDEAEFRTWLTAVFGE